MYDLSLLLTKKNSFLVIIFIPGYKRGFSLLNQTVYRTIANKKKIRWRCLPYCCQLGEKRGPAASPELVGPYEVSRRLHKVVYTGFIKPPFPFPFIKKKKAAGRFLLFFAGPQVSKSNYSATEKLLWCFNNGASAPRWRP